MISYEHVSFTALSILLYIQQSRIASEPGTAPETQLNILDGLFLGMSLMNVMLHFNVALRNWS